MTSNGSGDALVPDSASAVAIPPMDLGDAGFKHRLKRIVLFYALTALCVIVLAYLYQEVLGAFLVSAFLVYLINPVVKRLVERGMKRLFATALIAGGLFLAFIVGLGFLLPAIYRQVLVLVQGLPSAWMTITQKGALTLNKVLADLHISKYFRSYEFINEIGFVDQLREYLAQGVDQLLNASGMLLGGVIAAFLIPVFTVFMLLHLPGLKAEFLRLTPPKLIASQQGFFHKVDQTLRAVIQGQILVAVILAFLYMAGFSAVGLKVSLAIGAICGLCRVVPYLDVIVGIILCSVSIATHFEGWNVVFGSLLVILSVQTIDGLFITPRVIGHRVGLHPVVVLASLVAFGGLFGFLGILLAIPFVATAKVTLQQFLPTYLRLIRQIP